ncbi:K+-transporting ATPase ATPase B chain [Terrimicrobium sacchariphilum]|uniref:Potassium-transporting ATPase ATP-binding subunit n=1 Tax=Terrimicrobium sacchariphilum TaxID=690879 RepID=A0A146GEQ5_TERSA|nr:potassium-transporting ATPase subunit KdpB [Terrimicrobium sacchariphilum]GAT35117.1 K+-transporting ATPase ATPase B chain [Terrimicrobium sacchariphilum]
MSASKTDYSQLIPAAIRDSFLKLDPREQVKNPVMLVVFLGAIWTTVTLFTSFSGFNLQIAIWLWFTVLFANFAEAMAEGRGKAQANALRQARTQTMARRLRNGVEERVASTELRKGDLVACEANDPIPADGEVVEGVASVDEAAITGESAPVIRESGGDHSAVTGGTRVLSDRIVIRISADPGAGFLDRMISMVEGARRQKTPNEIALGILLVSITVLFLFAVFTLPAFCAYSEQAAGQKDVVNTSAPVLVSLLVCLIPTTIGALLSAIGISGIDRMIRRNVIATSGRAVEAAGDIDVLLLDKTGTITLGNRMATAFHPAPGVEERQLAEAAQLSSLADETPEGRSIVVLAKDLHGLRARDFLPSHVDFVPFTAQTRMSGIDIKVDDDGAPMTTRSIRKGAAEAIRQEVERQGGKFPAQVRNAVEVISKAGGTPLVVAEGVTVLGVVQLKDVVKGGIKERFSQLRKMGIRTVMITGDNPTTAAAIAAEAGVDEFMAEATPEMKLQRIRAEQAEGHLVAMTGDGTNDAPALAQADVGVAMNTGTQAAREAGNMVDLDSNPTKLIEVVEIGKQLLMTRGALTTFSIANDVAKYFAILPAMFATLYALKPGAPGPLAALNIMGLHSPESAILSAVIFNALIIIALIPLALRGVAYRATGASQVLLRNIIIYGLGGVIAPFIGIKLIDMLLVTLHLA